MPLEHGQSKKAFSHNVRAEMHAGKPQKQSLAIAYAMKRRGQHKKKMAHGGNASHGNEDQMQDIPEKMRDKKPQIPHPAQGTGNFNYPVGQTLARGGMAGDGIRPPYPYSPDPLKIPPNSRGNTGTMTGGAAARNMYSHGGNIMDEAHVSHLNPSGYSTGGSVYDEDHVSKMKKGNYWDGGATKSMYYEGGPVTRPAKEKIPKDDQARLHDPVLTKFSDESSEDLHPTYEPEKGVEHEMHKQHDFPFRKQNYEYPPPKFRSDGPVHVDDENLAENMFHSGGIAKAIFLKHAKSQAQGGEYPDSGIFGGDRFKTDRAHEESDHVYSKGGITPDEGGDQGGIYKGGRFIADPDDEEEEDAYAFGGGIDSTNRFKTDRGHEEEDHIYRRAYAGNYAKGGRIEWGESIDNQYPDQHPDNDYLSDEEQTPYFNYTDADTFDPNEKRRKFIANSMRKAYATGGRAA